VEELQQSTGVSRGQNQLLILPEDAATAAEVIAPLLERVSASTPATQLLVIASDPEAAAAMATALTRDAGETGCSRLPTRDAPSESSGAGASRARAFHTWCSRPPPRCSSCCAARC
jgi:hypothetical protein